MEQMFEKEKKIISFLANFFTYEIYIHLRSKQFFTYYVNKYFMYVHSKLS